MMWMVVVYDAQATNIFCAGGKYRHIAYRRTCMTDTSLSLIRVYHCFRRYDPHISPSSIIKNSTTAIAKSKSQK